MVNLVPAHPRFLERFSGDLYQESAVSEFGPFASDEGADLLAEWSTRVDELSSATTLRELLLNGVENAGGESWNAITTGRADDDLTISAGFVLLRLTGQIDHEGSRVVIDALLRSRERSPFGQPAFDRMIADLGGTVLLGSELSDELREMLDPDFGPPVLGERTAWFVLETVRWRLPRGVLLPTKYLQRLGRLKRQLNDDPAWWRWWDASHPGDPTTLDAELRWATTAPRSSVRSDVNNGRTEARVVVGVSIVELDNLRTSNSAAAHTSQSHAEMARDHIGRIMKRVTQSLELPPHPELPR